MNTRQLRKLSVDYSSSLRVRQVLLCVSVAQTRSIDGVNHDKEVLLEQ